MLYREIMAVCSQIHTKHINTLCGQYVELLNVKLAVYIVTTVFERSTVLPNTSKQLYLQFLCLPNSDKLTPAYRRRKQRKLPRNLVPRIIQ